MRRERDRLNRIIQHMYPGIGTSTFPGIAAKSFEEAEIDEQIEQFSNTFDDEAIMNQCSGPYDDD